MDQPNSQTIAAMVEKAIAKISEEGEENFYPSDVTKLKNNEAYAARFWRHQGEGKDREENAVKMILKTFKWRKDFGVEEINEKSLNKNLISKGVIYSHNRDKKGHKLLIVSMKKHFKGAETFLECQQGFVYYLERLEREENGGPITVVLDGTGMGYGNLDIGLYQFVVSMLVDIYPAFVDHSLMLEMPWIFNAAWKVIKVVIPAHILERTKFVNKSQIGEYIDDANRLKSWGGNDDYEYVFDPEA